MCTFQSCWNSNDCQEVFCVDSYFVLCITSMTRCFMQTEGYSKCMLALIILEVINNSDYSLLIIIIIIIIIIITLFL